MHNGTILYINYDDEDMDYYPILFNIIILNSTASSNLTSTKLNMDYLNVSNAYGTVF